MTILDEILAWKLREIEHLRTSIPLKELERLIGDMEPPRGFRKALLAAPGVALIAEVKKGSPSKGVIREDFDAVDIAKAYARGGATCLSILTDEKFFLGHLDNLQSVRHAVRLPLLRKDFILHAHQIYESRAGGADAILLIVRAVGHQIRELSAIATALGMDVLVEVHDVGELRMADDSGADLIGINNRNLDNFVTDVAMTERVAPLVPPGTVVVSESGISSPADLSRVAACGVKAVLVGEALMREPDVEAATRRLLGG